MSFTYLVDSKSILRAAFPEIIVFGTQVRFPKVVPLRLPYYCQWYEEACLCCNNKDEGPGHGFSCYDTPYYFCTCCGNSFCECVDDRQCPLCMTLASLQSSDYFDIYDCDQCLREAPSGESAFCNFCDTYLCAECLLICRRGSIVVCAHCNLHNETD